MKLLRTLENRLGRFAIPNLTPYIVMGQTFFFLVGTTQPDMLRQMLLIPERVLAGEVWRLLVFLFIPPTMNVIFIFFALYLFYIMGSALENHWGHFRYNLFVGVGYLATIAAAFLAPGGGEATNVFILTSVFLAFAHLYPDFEILLFFILPVKIRWLAVVTWVFMGIALLLAPDWMTRLTVAASVANYLLFFGTDIVQRMRRGHRRMVMQSAAMGPAEDAFHRCVVCGRTEVTNRDLDFRYHRDDAGKTSCYCMDHLPR